MVFHLVASAQFHQGDVCLPEQARGRQCVPCSLMFLVVVRYVRQGPNLQTDDLNNILLAGSQLYCAIHNSETTSGVMDPQDLPKSLIYRGHKVFIHHNGLFSGFLGDSVQNDGSVLFTLEQALFKRVSVRRSTCFILVFSGLSVGIHCDKDLFYVFDSHSRNHDGFSSSDGTSVLGVFHSVSGVCSYFCGLVKSLQKNPDVVQFDLHHYALSKHYNETVNVVEILDNPVGYRIKKQVHKRKKTFPSSQSKRQYIDSLVGNRSLSHCIDDRHVSSSMSGTSHHKNDCPVAHGMSDLVSKFHDLVASGPDYVCSCCTQTFFKHSVKKSENLPIARPYLNGYQSVGNIEWICTGCLNAIRKDKTPQYWLHNGLAFPSCPPELHLSQLEERLVSPRLPFMQLREMPRGGQINMKGNIVNVPADVNGTIKLLPRMVSDNETIMLKLKRKLSYKHHVAFENIRPNKVFGAAKWLLANSSLFQNEGIVLDESWLQQPHDSFNISIDSTQQDMSSQDNAEKENDTWTEDDSFNERITGNLDTFLQSLDFREFNQILCVAPGQESTPISLFQDIQSEILSFPTIFCGQPRTDNSKRLVPLHFSAICKWELRNVDRRVATCIPNIFFKLKRLQIKQIRDKVSLAIRKCKTKGRTITVSDFMSPGFVENMTMQNDGYRVLRTLRGSPPYWEQAKRDVFSMIRQLGIPTWFCSFSAAETKWEPLLQSLSKLVNGKNITLEEARTLNWHEKCTLIKSDPVTCARYFDYRVQAFIKNVLKHPSLPIGDIVDFFYRVEFQQRGSPHIHMLVWVKGAPVHGSCLDSVLVAFIDKYVTCRKDESIPVLINYQTHRHAGTCRKKGKDVCRFNFPLFPMPETTILYPIENTCEQNDHSAYVKKIVSLLNDLHKAESNVNFDEFLAELGIDYALYVKSVRSTLNRPKIFLKRSVAESRINNYNETLIKSWMANMDLQFVLDPFSCVSYIVSYISKGQRGLSNLLKDACADAQQADSDVRQQVRRIGNQFLSSVEIGAQEAVYLVLQIPLRRCSREVIFVDTRKPDDRTSLIKPLSQLKDLPGNSSDVEMDNILKRYKRRSYSMEMMCYADFASWYDLCKGHAKKIPVEDMTEELPEIEYEYDHDDDMDSQDVVSDGTVTRFPCGTCVRKRCKQKVIYTHITPLNQDREEHFREKIMLYTHWRNDERDLISQYGTFEESFSAKKVEIDRNIASYEKCAVEYEILHNGDDDCSDGFVNAESSHQEAVDMNEDISRASILGCFDPGTGLGEFEDYDLGEDLGVARRCLGSEILPHNEVDNDSYFEQMQGLNNEQRKFFYYVVHAVKTKSLPFYTFLSGGGGVGKSVVTRAIYQALLKYFNHRLNEDPETVKLLLCAPTGKAAHNIGGSTIHSAFCIPANQGFHFKPLDMQQLNTLRARFRSLRVVIIDEISMVGRSMFNFINLRLQEIMACTKPFGNISVLAVGDLYQLKPVMDSWIFSQAFRSNELTCLAANPWVELFKFFELTTIMRQRDDVAFAQLLNRLREGNHTDSDLAVLRSREVKQDNKEVAHFPHLFCTRVDVHTHNLAILADLPASDLQDIQAIDDISGDVNSTLRETILSRIPNDPSKTMGLQTNLILGIGLQAEICLNIDTSDGLTNGASCCIKKFDFRVPGSSRCSIVWVQFGDVSVGQIWRTKYRHLFTDGIPLAWTPILETSRKFSFKYFKTYLVIRRQFPLYLSAGKTIHKAQGSTMKEAVMHFGRRKIDHIHYVGLSRVTSLSGVHISELNEAKICVSTEVEAEMDRLRSERIVEDTPPSLDTFPTSTITVCFHNCRSLQRHIDDFKHESNLLSSDIIGLAETRVWGANAGQFEVDGFQLISATADQSAHGLAIYCRCNVNIDQLFLGTVHHIEYCLIGISKKLVLGFVYCPPNKATILSISSFLSAVSATVLGYFEGSIGNIVLMGDFNFDSQKNKSLSTLFGQTLALRQLVSCITTDYDSCIDHIYSNLSQEHMKMFGTLESYYSDHKPLFCNIYV